MPTQPELSARRRDKLQEETYFDNRIVLTVDGRNVATISDGLQGEPYGENGWYARFSTYGEDKTDS